MEKIKESRSANQLAFIKHAATTCGCLRVYSLNMNLPPKPPNPKPLLWKGLVSKDFRRSCSPYTS